MSEKRKSRREPRGERIAPPPDARSSSNGEQRKTRRCGSRLFVDQKRGFEETNCLLVLQLLAESCYILIDANVFNINLLHLLSPPLLNLLLG